ncbi:MAG: cytochrome c-type biogenesis protein CcmH [Verrucomicrobiales bacterium]|jgi:cytochrome c-type biogenesis protein CcmH
MSGIFSKRSVLWLGLLAAALSALLVSTQVDGPPRTNEDRVRSLSEDFACPTCDGQSVAESNAVVAVEIRRDIRRRVDEGETNGEITDALVASYDESIDLRPRSGGVVGLIWIVPVVVMVFGFAALASVFRRWRTVETQHASDDDVALVDSLRRERS